jgi:hypothetical protein
MKINLTKSYKFTLLTLAIVVVILYISWNTGSVSVDWNGMFNGVLQGTVVGFLTMALTIIVYRKIYHNKSGA